MPESIQLDTDALRASILRVLDTVGDSDRRLIDEILRLRNESAPSPESRRSYDDAIKALEKSIKQKAVPVRKRIAEVIVLMAAELELPLTVSDQPPRRRVHKLTPKEDGK